LNWLKVKLSDFLFPRDERFNPNDKAVIGLKRISKIDFSGNIFISDKNSNTDMILVKNGDLVISGINVSKGAMSVYQGNEDILATIHYSSYIYNKKKVDIDFLKYFLKSSKFIQALRNQVSGGIKTEIKSKLFLSLVVEIPETLEEQKYIVNVLNNYIRLIDDIKNEQSQQAVLITKIKQQILNNAVQGKLTEKWRLKYKAIEPASEIIKRINNLNITNNRKYQTSISQDEVPFNLPSCWTWTRLGKLLSFGPTNGYSPKATKTEKGIKCLTLTATTSGYFKENCYKIVDIHIPEESYLWLNKNDILLQRGNSIDYVGIAAIYEDEPKKYIYPDLMIKINVFEFIIPKYIYYVLISPFNRIYFQKNAYGTQKSMPKINQKVVLNTLIPLPPIHEQKVIVDKIEILLERCHQLQKVIESQLNITKYLINLIFNETFESTKSIDITEEQKETSFSLRGLK